MKKILFGLVSLFIIVNTGILKAQNQAIVKMDSLVNLFTLNNCFNGDILVTIDDKTFYKKSVGYRDNVYKEVISANSIFNIGSISKPFTSVAILQLHHKKLLNINEPVKKYIPEFPYENILIRHLLSHTSGLKQHWEQIEEADLEIYHNNDSLISILVKHKPELFAQPGSEFIYSNLGYEVLAVLVERTSKMDFENYMKKNIFGPSGMKKTFIPSDPDILKWLPKGISEKDLLIPHDFKNIDDCEVSHVDSVNFKVEKKNFTMGSENVYSCVNDLAKFDKALRKNKILPAYLQELAYTPYLLTNGDTAKDANAPIPSYFGMGWFISIEQNNGRIIWHKGRSFGSRSVFLRNPSKKQVVSVTDNFDYPAVDLKGISLLRTLNNEPYRNPILISIVQRLGCEMNMYGIDNALTNLNKRKDTERYNFYISEDEMQQLCQLLENNNKWDDFTTIVKFSMNLFVKSPWTYSEYGKIMFMKNEQDSAMIFFKKAVYLYGESDIEKESYLNNLGYYYLYNHQNNLAEFVLKLNTELFSLSSNTYDSYAQVLSQNNKKEQAILMEEKAVGLAIVNNDPLLETLKQNLELLKQK